MDVYKVGDRVIGTRGRYVVIGTITDIMAYEESERVYYRIVADNCPFTSEDRIWSFSENYLQPHTPLHEILE